jgi:hypothetical protein
MGHFQQIQKSDSYPEPLISLSVILNIEIDFIFLIIHSLVTLLYLS